MQVLNDPRGVGAESAENSNRAFGLARDGKSAAGVEIALSERLFDLLKRDVVFQQGALD